MNILKWLFGKKKQQKKQEENLLEKYPVLKTPVVKSVGEFTKRNNYDSGSGGYVYDSKTNEVPYNPMTDMVSPLNPLRSLRKTK